MDSRAVSKDMGETVVAGSIANRKRIQRLARVTLFAALAIVLSYIETMIPLPTSLPGIKLGLANIAVVVALYAIDWKTALAVAAVKVFAAGFLFGSPMMLAYSLGGTALAYLGMVALRRIPGMSVVVVSVTSAILHNVGQLAVAMVMLGSTSVFLSLPPLLVAACVTGALTGFVAAAVLGGSGVGNGVDGEERPVVDASCLDIRPGEHIAFVGANGSGKTSCALQLAGLVDGDGSVVGGAGGNVCGVGNGDSVSNGDDVDDGAAGLDCFDVGHVGGPDDNTGTDRDGSLGTSSRPSVGMAFQDPDSQIVASKVRDDVAFGPENRGMEQKEMVGTVEDALERAGVSELAERDVTDLSGGQKQRVAVAGLLAMTPSLVIFDESTAMLDPRARGEFHETVEQLLSNGLSVITITQIMDEAFLADRIAVFSDGAIVALKTPGELLEDPAVLLDNGLELPHVAALAQKLRESGVDVPMTNDRDRLEAELCRLYARA